MLAGISSMRVRILAIGFVAAVMLSGADKKPPVRSMENDAVEITATPIADREGVRQALGSDLGGHYILVEVRVAPKDGQKIAVHLDDFLLRTDKDGERTTPFAPSQIAGRGALVISPGASSGGGSMAEPVGPTYGGGPYGGPLGGGPLMGPGGVGVGGSDASGEVAAKVQNGSKEKPNPMLEVLKQKILPEKETDAPVSGLLYFPMEKQKVKDLELIYTTPSGKLSVRFK
jgi:hypothetical protein